MSQWPIQLRLVSIIDNSEKSIPDGERFLRARNGRFPLFALISSSVLISPNLLFLNYYRNLYGKRLRLVLNLAFRLTWRLFFAALTEISR